MVNTTGNPEKLLRQALSCIKNSYTKSRSKEKNLLKERNQALSCSKSSSTKNSKEKTHEGCRSYMHGIDS